MQNLPSLDEYQQIQTELEMKSITHQKINHQLEDARHEIDYKSKELSKSQRDVMNLQVEVSTYLLKLYNKSHLLSYWQYFSSQKLLKKHERFNEIYISNRGLCSVIQYRFQRKTNNGFL